MSKKIAITLGDPAAIGPDICVKMARDHLNRNHIVITDPGILLESAKKLNTKIHINQLKKIICKQSVVLMLLMFYLLN